MATLAVENDQEERKEARSLLVQALEVPSLNGEPLRSPPPQTQSSRSSDSGLSFGGIEPFLPRHSDFTVPTSNISMDMEDPLVLGIAPPDHVQSSATRRSVFGGRISEKYGSTAFRRVESSDTLPMDNQDPSAPLPSAPPQQHNAPILPSAPQHNASNLSDITPPVSPEVRPFTSALSPLSPYIDYEAQPTKRRIRAHETIHAQSLLLGFAFMAIWSPQNIMAPNLTEIADDFGFSAQERDFYLGANIALATGVLSLPLSAGIGILTDMYNRKHLFVATVAMGGLTAWATGFSQTYKWLFVARLLNGGCMSGSVPVAFSLLGDLFHTHERNAASAALTAMMGVGIVAGQVYAGVVGSTLGWPHAFYMSAIWTTLSALLVLLFVQEPVRGGKEKVLQDMIQQGTQYDRTLSWKGFLHAMRHNKSNLILMWQGFFSSVPWGIIFVFLNDYLSQERGFSVPDATYIVFIFGLGCAAGGVLGGWWGQVFMSRNRSYLPLFMAATTFLGIFPFLGLLNGSFTDAHGVESVFFSFMGGLIASLPSVNVRPCIINVNPPETRGAALTAANLIINVARGAGPSCITLMGAIWHVNRQFSFNVTLAGFWILSALQLLLLARTLPRDQDAMEAELAEYAEARLQEKGLDEEDSIVSIEERMTSFDAGAARESIQFMGEAFREISDEIRTIRPLHGACQFNKGGEEDEEDKAMDRRDFERRRRIWIERQVSHRHQDSSPRAPPKHVGNMENNDGPATETTQLLQT